MQLCRVDPEPGLPAQDSRSVRATGSLFLFHNSAWFLGVASDVQIAVSGGPCHLIALVPFLTANGNLTKMTKNHAAYINAANETCTLALK